MLGVIALSALTLLAHWIFFRPALSDGQYAFVIFLTIPVGALLGAITGAVVQSMSQGQAVSARLTALLGGSILAVVFLLVGLLIMGGTERPSLAERTGATLFWFGLPLLWTGLLILTGLKIRTPR